MSESPPSRPGFESEWSWKTDHHYTVEQIAAEERNKEKKNDDLTMRSPLVNEMAIFLLLSHFMEIVNQFQNTYILYS